MEFALILPVLMILVFGVVELGRALYQLNTLSKATDAGVRYISRGWQVLDADCQPGSRWLHATSTTAQYVVFGNETGTGPPILPGLSVDDVKIEAGARSTEEGGSGCVVTVTTATSFDAVLGKTVVPFTSIGPIELRASKEGRYLAQ